MQEDAFEQSSAEVFFYNYSSQIASPVGKRRTHRESPPRLQLPRPQPTLCIDVPKRKQGGYQTSRVIKIGNVTFKSNFESGNLATAQQSNLNTYIVSMQKESSSQRTSAWFYFSVEGVKGQANIVVQGFTKSSSLYNEGMKVCYREGKEAKWRRGGSHISYGGMSESESEYELRFTYFFKTNEYTCVEFAYCFPYSFRQLIQTIHTLPNIHLASIGKSKDGRDIPMLTMGNRESPKAMFFSARVHPGETVSSFIMDGFIHQLISQSEFGCMLRREFQIKVVPMLNPDGVVRGNYRFSAVGQDLNRRWLHCKEDTHPEIHSMRELMRRTKREKEVVLYIDIHGHSRKKNVFFYGCSEGKEGVPARGFPHFMEKLHEAYSYENSCFAVQKDKEGTARVAMWRELKIHHVYTLQASFCGTPSLNYLESDYMKVGRKLCEGVAAYFCSEESMGKEVSKMMVLKQKANQQLQSSEYLMGVGAEDESGSDSEPERGEMVAEERPSAVNHTSASAQRTLNTQKRQFVRSIPQHTTKFRSERMFTDEMKPYASKIMEYTKEAVRVMNHPEIKLSTNVNKYEMESLNSSSLHQKNIRVHSMSRTTNRLLTKMVLDTQNTEERKIDLMHGKEGAQYRRVKKMAEALAKKEYYEEEQKKVRCLFTQQIDIAKSKTIAPRFYPVSQQRTRRNTAEVRGKKMSVNGEEINVQCLGNRITLA